MTKSDFLFLLGSSAARGAGLYQAVPARGYHGPHGHRRQHQHGQGHRDQVGYKTSLKMDIDICMTFHLPPRCGIVSSGDGYLVMEGKEFNKRVRDPHTGEVRTFCPADI